MQLQALPETGSFARFFLEMAAMFLLVAAFAYGLITAVYAEAAAPQLPLIFSPSEPLRGATIRLLPLVRETSTPHWKTTIIPSAIWDPRRMESKHEN